MGFNIEGWIPTELEQSLIDGSFDAEMASRDDIPKINDDLLDISEFSLAMEKLKSEIATWPS